MTETTSSAAHTVDEETVEKKAAQIAGLLAKAESTTPEEAKALQERVAFLMAKYAIDEARIQAAKASGAQDTIVDERIDITGSYAVAEQDLLLGICRANDIKPLVGGSGTKRYVRMIGFKSDVQQTRLLFDSLQIQAGLALKDFVKSNPYPAWMGGMDKYKTRRDFVFGFSAAVQGRIRKGKEAALAEAKQEDEAAGRTGEAGTDLVLVRKADQISSYIDSNFAGLRMVRDRTQRGYGAGYSGGRAAGANANVNGAGQGAIGGTKRAIR